MKIRALDHIGIRVMDIDRSVVFYKRLGFRLTREDYRENVFVMKHASGIEINLLVSGDNDNAGKNILMDVDERYPGYTHFAIEVESSKDAIIFLQEKNIKITEGPVTFGDGKTSVFVRDPDLNVIEFTELPKS